MSPTAFRIPVFVVNFKSYVWGRKALGLAKIIDEVAQESDVYLCVIPQVVDIVPIARETRLPVFAPHVDPEYPGRGTGYILPEAIKEAGAVGALFNHAENRVTLERMSETIKRVREVGLTSMIGAATPKEAGAIATMGPDVILSEPPSRIGTLSSVGRDKEFVTESVRRVKNTDIKITVVCGAGVSSGKDVAEIVRLGVEGTGASRAICEAKEPRRILTEMLQALEYAWKLKPKS